jgi:hypothetical protein
MNHYKKIINYIYKAYALVIDPDGAFSIYSVYAEPVVDPVVVGSSKYVKYIYNVLFGSIIIV